MVMMAAHGARLWIAKRAGELLKSRYAGLETKVYVGSIGAANRFTTKEDIKRIMAECSAVIGSTAD
jgi:hypothetical protein